MKIQFNGMENKQAPEGPAMKIGLGLDASAWNTVLA
jgi:hypothetical protein